MIALAKDGLRKLLPKNRFARGVTVLVGGTAAAQAIQLLSSPFLSRLYNPAAFGLLAVFVATISLLNIVSSLRYECAIPLPKLNEDARYLVHLSVIILCSLTLILFLALLGFGDYLLYKFSLELLIPYKYFFPITFFFTGMYQIFSNWSVRKKRFFELSRTEVTKSAAAILVQLPGFLLGAAGLILGQMASVLVGILPLLRSYQGDWKKEVTCKKIKFSPVLDLACRYRQFPFYSTPNGLFNTAGRELPPILFAAAFSPDAAGMYFMAYRMTQKPILLLTTANAKVFTSHAPEAYRTGNLGNLYSALHSQSVRIFTFPMALAALVAPYTFSFIFGVEWELAGVVSAILMPWILMIALINPLSPTVGIVDRQGTALCFEIMLGVLRLGGLGVGIYHGSFLLAVTLFSGGAVVGIVSKMLWLAKIAGADVKVVFIEFLKEIAKVAPLLVAGYMIIKNLHFCISILFLTFMAVFSFKRSLNAFRKGIDFG